MDRRMLLSALGAGLAGLAGCSGALGGREPTPTLTPADVPEPARTPAPTPRPTPTGETCGGDGYLRDQLPIYDLPDPPERFADLGCPSFEWAGKTVCYHAADHSWEPLVLVGGYEPARVSHDDGAVAEFALVNRGNDAVRVQPTTWSVLAPATPDAADESEIGPCRRGWTTVAAGEHSCTRTLHDETVHWWHLGVETAVRTDRVNVTAPEVSLGTGTYLFVVPVLRADAADIVCVAPFDVEWATPVDVETPVPEDSTSSG